MSEADRSFQYTDIFPHDEIRDVQNKGVDFALDSFINQKKRFCVIEAGTGVGKSAIGVTVARYLRNHNFMSSAEYGEGAYFITTQKLLQDQYIRDFGPPDLMRSIKSSVNYQCHFHKKNQCSESQQLLRTTDKSSRFFKACMFNCTYKNAKKEFLDSCEGITNFPYLLTESNYSGKSEPRRLLVIDEAHNIESELSKFIEISISERFAKHVLKLRFPNKTTQHQVVLWVRDVYFPKAVSQLQHAERMIEKFGENFREKLKEFKKVMKHYDLLRGHVSKIKTFLSVYDKDNWVFELIPGEDRSLRKFSFKPIDVSPFSQDCLFRLGEKILMMSATILDKDAFCQSLGIDKNDVAFLTVPSPFPIKNRPIFVFGVGKMSAKHIDKTLPKLAKAVQEILDNHKDEKGIIHCHTYKIANYLKKTLKNRRLLVHNSTNRDETLQKHIKSKTPTVLLSPSMTEGVDLKGDLARFQIICKIPYPYYGSPLVRKKMKKHPWWYGYSTAKTIVQSVGRSVRNSDDFAVTYILDDDWHWFYSKNRQFFSSDFKQCLRG